MRLVSIVSHGNGAGKTRLITSAAEAWPGRFAAVKFTTIFQDGNFCPRDVQATCACSKLHGEYQVITDGETLAEPDTDTGRMVAAGLSPVIWCLAQPEHHGSAWPHVQEFLEPDAQLLTEGNTAMLSIEAEAMLFLVNPAMPRRYWKGNWRELAQRADAVLVNEAPEALGRRRAAGPAEREASLAEVQEAAPSTPRIVARLEAPLREWAGPLVEGLFEGR